MLRKIQRYVPLFEQDFAKKLPEGYKKFYQELKTKPLPVHFIPNEKKWERNPENGEIKRVITPPLPLLFPPEMNTGLWGGEAIVKGFQKRGLKKRRIAHYWVPQLLRTVVYSEVLDKYISVVVTSRLIDLIHEHKGFDHYLLQSNACDIRSQLGFNIKRSILLALHENTLYPDDKEKREEIYNKYKHYLERYDKEFSEWYGFTLNDALKKFNIEEAKKRVVEPLKIKYRLQLIEKLREGNFITEKEQKNETNWISRINPFGEKN